MTTLQGQQWLEGGHYHSKNPPHPSTHPSTHPQAVERQQHVRSGREMCHRRSCLMTIVSSRYPLCDSGDELMPSDMTQKGRELQLQFRPCCKKKRKTPCGTCFSSSPAHMTHARGRRVRGVVCRFGKTVINMTNGALCVLFTMCATSMANQQCPL